MQEIKMFNVRNKDVVVVVVDNVCGFQRRRSCSDKERWRICITALMRYLNSYTCAVNSFLTDTPIRRTLL